MNDTQFKELTDGLKSLHLKVNELQARYQDVKLTLTSALDFLEAEFKKNQKPGLGSFIENARRKIL